MILTNKQEQGLRIAIDRYNNKEPWTCIAGYAGTGKSTLVKFIVAALELEEKDVAYCSFTGKAAQVLSRKGCANATTAHKLLYRAKMMADGSFVLFPKKRGDLSYKLIVCDEISMLPANLWNLLLRHNIPIICLGDPAQLPPIGEDNGVLQHPHIFLDEIMRQAQESEIIRLTMEIRENKPLNFRKGNEVIVIPQQEVVTGMYDWADQVIAATNKKRKEINNDMRLLKFGTTFQNEPIVGDKIVSLKNDWNIINKDGEALVNGSIGYINDIEFEDDVPYYGTKAHCTFMPDSNSGEMNMLLDYNYLAYGVETCSKDKFWIFKKNKLAVPHLFDYGYCITCHRAQGSEWDNVLVFEERFPFDRDEHRRWLYTAATRAAKKLVIVRS